MRGLKQFLAIGLSALLVCSTLTSDYMVASAEEIVDEIVGETIDGNEETVAEDNISTEEETAAEEIKEGTEDPSEEDIVLEEEDKIEETAEVEDETLVKIEAAEFDSTGYPTVGITFGKSGGPVNSVYYKEKPDYWKDEGNGWKGIHHGTTITVVLDKVDSEGKPYAEILLPLASRNDSPEKYFMGWRLESDASQWWSEGSVVTIYGNMDFEPKWSDDGVPSGSTETQEANYTVKYFLQNADLGDSYSEDEPARVSGMLEGEKGEELTLSAAALRKDADYVNYDFDHFEPASESDTVIVTEGTELKFYYNLKTVNLTYDKNAGGEEVNSFPEPCIRTYPKGSDVVVADSECTRAGYEFKGWKDENGDPYMPGATIEKLTNDTILYAQWDEITVTLTFTADAAGSVDGVSPQTISAAKGSPAAVAAVPGEGYVFDHWTADGERADEFAAALSVENIDSKAKIGDLYKNTEFKAYFKKIAAVEFKQLFLDTMEQKDIVKKNLNPITGKLMDADDVTAPSESDYRFVGWVKDEDRDNILEKDSKLGIAAIEGYVEKDGTEFVDTTFVALYKKAAIPGFKLVGDDVIYDGEAHMVAVSADIPGTEFTYSCKDENGIGAAYDPAKGLVDAGTYVVTVKAECPGYEDESLSAELVIRKRPVEIVSVGKTKAYDGTALTNHECLITPYDPDKKAGFIEGQGVDITYTGSQTDVGGEPGNNTFTYSAKAGTDLNNYKIDCVYGTLTVTENAAQITVTTGIVEVTYDGLAHGAAVEVSELPAGYTLIKAESSATATHVIPKEDGGYAAVPADCDTLVIVNGKGEDVTDKLNIKKVPGRITITPAPLAIKTPSATKVYDGTALTAAGTAEECVSGLVNNETIGFETTGSQTTVGFSENTYSINWGSTLETDYKIADEVLGKLVVTESEGEIVFVITGGRFTYDGKLHGAKVELMSKLPEGYTLEKAESEALAVDVTREAVTADCDRLVIRNTKGEDVTAGLKITKVPGSITIIPARLSLVIPDITKEYDAVEITAPKAVLTGLVAGETLDVTIRNSMKDVKRDAADNAVGVEIEYELGWKKTADNKLLDNVFTLFNATISNAAKESNYVLDATVGMMTITPAKLTVTTQSAARIYNGKALTADGKYEGLKGNDEIHFTVTGSQTQVGTSVNTYEILWLGALESNYNVVEDLGTLTVNAAPSSTPSEPTGATPDTPAGDDAVTTTPDEPTSTASAADVLGAKRGVEADASSVQGAGREQAVLGARRGAQTGDENEIARYFMMMGLSVSIAGLYSIARRKKRSEVK